MKDEYIDILNRILPQMGKRTDIIVSWLTESIGYKSSEIDIAIIDYLQEREFAEFSNDIATENAINLFNRDTWRSRTIRLLDRGRKLKDCGSVQEYDRVIQDEALLKTRLNQTVLRSYYINLCLAVSTGFAALYYIRELLKSYILITPDIKSCLILLFFGMCIGATILAAAQSLVQQKSKSKQESK